MLDLGSSWITIMIPGLYTKVRPYYQEGFYAFVCIP